MEETLNHSGLPLEERIHQAVDRLNVPPLDDSEGSFRYRLFVLKNTLRDVFHHIGGKEHHHG